MRRRLATVVGSLALTWLSGPARAADPVAPLAPATTLPSPAWHSASPALAPADTSTQADPCNDRGHLLGGVGFYLLKPHVQNNVAWQSNFDATDPVTGLRTVTSSETEFNYGYELAERFWLG